MTLIDGVTGASLAPDDRGLAYGDGCFETMRTARGVAPWLARHHARLATTCAALGFAAPDLAVLTDEIAQVAAGSARAVVKVVVTRGSGGRGYAPPADARPRRVTMAHPWPAHPVEHWRSGIVVRWCATRLASGSPLPGAKHLGRIAQVLARAEWSDPAIAEGLLLDDRGGVVEGTATNLFAVLDGTLCTPPIEGGAVAGVARAWILEHASTLGGRAVERRITPDELLDADELFVCNSTIGVWPVRSVATRSFAVGPRTSAIRDALEAEGFGP